MDNPLIPAVKYATLVTEGDGVQTQWEFNFAGGYISPEHVKAFTEDLTTGELVIRPLTLVGPNTAQITPAVAAGLRLFIYRDTPKTEPLVNYTTGSILNESSLDKSNQQAVFIAAELADRVIADYDFSNALLYAVTTAADAAATANGIDAKATLALATSALADQKATEALNIWNLVAVRPEAYGGRNSAAIQQAFDTGRPVLFSSRQTYTYETTVVVVGRVHVTAHGSRHEGYGDVLRIIDGSGSRIMGGLWAIPAAPWVIKRNPATWAPQTSADVVQSYDGNMPHSQDTDIWEGLSDAVKNQPSGPKIVFTSSSANPTIDIKVSDVTLLFGNLIFEGCSWVRVSDVDVHGGRDYGGIVFYNNTNLTRITNVPLAYTFAQGLDNRVTDIKAHNSNVCGVVFFGNLYWRATRVRAYGNSESGLKTYQMDSTFGPEIISKYGIATDVDGDENGFDGVDLGATYPTSGTQSGFNTVIRGGARRNRGTGCFSDAQSNLYIGFRASDNGLGGMTLQAANVTVADCVMENNVQHPGIFGEFPSYDMLLDGDFIVSNNNVIRRATPPPYQYTLRQIGSNGRNNGTYSPLYPMLVDTTNYLDTLGTQDRVQSVPSSYVSYLKTYESASIQCVLRLGRPLSEGVVFDFRQGTSETFCGSVAITTNATVYNTASDYRLKMNPVTLTGMLDKVMRLHVKSWDWVSLGVGRGRGRGWYAHELAAEFPEAVTGAKDQVDAHGNPVYQGVDPSKLVAPTISALQELAERLFALEKKVYGS